MQQGGADTPPEFGAFSAEDVKAREQLILGHPPRIPPLDRASIAQLAAESTARLRKAAVPGGATLKLDEIPEIVVTLLRYPALWEAICAVSIQLMGAGAKLPYRERQIAILRTAWVWQAPFEWGEHVKHARNAGLTAQEIEAIITGPDAPEWNALECAILHTVDELKAGAMVCDETWAVLAAHFDENQLFELLVLIGQFTNVAFFQNALRLRLEPGNKGLAAR
jgi:alkylhydroperoxidase family enzyme